MISSCLTDSETYNRGYVLEYSSSY